MHVARVFEVVVFQIASRTLMRVFQGVIGGSNILIKVAVSSTHITFFFSSRPLRSMVYQP
jgi:hypothetical protein